MLCSFGYCQLRPCRPHGRREIRSQRMPACKVVSAVHSSSPSDHPVARRVAGLLATAAVLCSSPALAAGPAPRTPPVVEAAGRCSLEALDVFAETRAKFSQEASGGNMTEAVVDIRGCDYSGKDLSGKVLSGVLMQNANFSNAKLTGVQFARARAEGAIMNGADLTDTNCYGTSFDGAQLKDTQWENAILSGATFARFNGEWADLKGAQFEGALLSSSDIIRICENPTLEESTKKFQLGCRSSR